MLNKTQFAVLTEIERSKTRITQREIAAACDLSIGSVNKSVSYLADLGCIKEMKITDRGYELLEPYRVKKVIFLAAGFGSRLVPITLNTPKPLVKVHGARMIETLLDAVVKAGIERIIIVRGYLSEQFDILLNKYPNIEFFENKVYNEANNISSAYVVKDLLAGSYVFEADLVLSNDSLITKYQYQSNYLGVPVEHTDDWCFKVQGNRIVKLGIGGVNCYHMFGISYWSEEDGKKLSEHIEKVYRMPGGRERFWDQVALEYFADDYDVEVRSCTFDDIVEIDSFNDLKKIDKLYDCQK